MRLRAHQFRSLDLILLTKKEKYLRFWPRGTLKHETMGECFELRRSLSDLYDFTTALARETRSACECGWVASEQAYHKEERRKNQKYVRRAENAGAVEESFRQV